MFLKQLLIRVSYHLLILENETMYLGIEVTLNIWKTTQFFILAASEIYFSKSRFQKPLITISSNLFCLINSEHKFVWAFENKLWNNESINDKHQSALKFISALKPN